MGGRLGLQSLTPAESQKQALRRRSMSFNGGIEPSNLSFSAVEPSNLSLSTPKPGAKRAPSTPGHSTPGRPPLNHRQRSHCKAFTTSTPRTPRVSIVRMNSNSSDEGHAKESSSKAKGGNDGHLFG